MVLKALTRILMNVFGENARKNENLKKLECIAMLVSIPLDVVEVESIWNMYGLDMDEEERRKILQLRM